MDSTAFQQELSSGYPVFRVAEGPAAPEHPNVTQEDPKVTPRPSRVKDSERSTSSLYGDDTTSDNVGKVPLSLLDSESPPRVTATSLWCCALALLAALAVLAFLASSATLIKNRGIEGFLFVEIKNITTMTLETHNPHAADPYERKLIDTENATDIHRALGTAATDLNMTDIS